MKKKTTILLLAGSLMIAGIAALLYQSQNSRNQIRHYTAFFSTTGEEITSDNDMKKKIAEQIGADCEETWLKGQTKDNALNAYIAAGEYPDFISGESKLYDAGALIPIDEYWDNYPNIKNYLTEEQWDLFRQADGHIYWIPQFGVSQGQDTEVIHSGEAFWIQTRVLKWADYPEITTVDEYFDLLERYQEANPCLENGTPNIPFAILCDDWRYFCLENVPQFLDGYPNDGSCIVDPDTLQVIDYNTTPTAKRYYQKLNEEYKKVKNQWHTARSAELDTASGLSITISCEDPEGAMQFVNNLLDPEITKLRFWGEENLDYSIDENGIFYLNEEQGVRVNDRKLKKTHFCTYSYFPRSEGMLSDGINAFSPENQPVEFWKSQPRDIQECFEAYGVTNYVDMLGRNDAPGVWYPMYSYTNSLTSNTQAGQTLERMDEVKHRWLPQVILAQNFEETWNSYMEAYNACDPQSYFEDLQKELDQRMNKKNSNFCILNDKN